MTGVDRLARVVVALYPRAMRDEYGPEIAGLLERSSRPMRDLLDVARCAIAERARFLSYGRLRLHLSAAGGLLFTPTAFTGFYLVLAFVFAVVFEGVLSVSGWTGQSPEKGRFAETVMVTMTTLVLVRGAIWFAGHTKLPFTPALAPTWLAAGALPVTLLFGVPAGPTAAAIGVWWVAVSVTSIVGMTLRQASRRRTLLTMLIAGLLANELAFTVYGLAIQSSPLALVVYPAGVLGLDLRMIIDPSVTMTLSLAVLPTLLTACTGYALRLATMTNDVLPVGEPSLSTN